MTSVRHNGLSEVNRCSQIFDFSDALALDDEDAPPTKSSSEIIKVTAVFEKSTSQQGSTVSRTRRNTE